MRIARNNTSAQQVNSVHTTETIENGRVTVGSVETQASISIMFGDERGEKVHGVEASELTKSPQAAVTCCI